VSTTDTLLFSIPVAGRTIPVTLWTLFGLIGNLLFTTRVLLQWIASERRKQTVTPVSFWWLSLSGALVLIVYAFGKLEIPFILGYAVSLVPYFRNLRIAYYPDRPARRSGWIVTAALGLACVPIIVFWQKQAVQDGWFYFGLLGNAVFGSRFFVQWVQSEKRRESVLPLPFWYLSLVGAVILLVYAIIRNDLVFILGFLFNVIPYSRNIYLIRRGRKGGAGESAVAADEG
jgi:lipid-A-disaccharide synthase-like uncharacterized protein